MVLAVFFADAETFWDDSIRMRARKLHAHRLIDSVLVPLVMSSKASRSCGYCIKHNAVCVTPSADVHLAGTPSAAYSPRGDELGLEDLTVLVYLSWISQRRLLQEPWVVQENVPEFPTEHLRSMLGDLYEIMSCVLNPAMLGWPVQRVRNIML